MNLNIIGYSIYFIITGFIIIRVGKICYDNGNIFVSALIPDHADLCQKVNQILLVGYYLINIGYCAITIINWNKIENSQILIEMIASKTSVIICLIAILHYLNIILIKNFVQKLIN